MHGLQRGKLTPYGVQLREKQKAKRIYGVLESQFRKYFQWAESQKGVTGENLLRLLELRLDNVVYRLGFAASRRESRQMVAHGHFQVNGRKVTVPSFLAKVGDVVQLRPTSKMGPRIDDNANAGRGQLPQWLDLDVNAQEAVSSGACRSARTSRSPCPSSSSSSCTASKETGSACHGFRSRSRRRSSGRS